METATKRAYRSRRKTKKTHGVIIKTLNDAHGFADPLLRYGELPTLILGALYNSIRGLSKTSEYYLDRLTDLTHEAEGMPSTRKVMIRPKYQWRHGINHQTIYRRTAGTALFASAKHLYTPEVIAKANEVTIVQVPEDENAEPTIHDSSLALQIGSLEILARRSPEIEQHITHLDILAHASFDAKHAKSPFSIPVPEIRHRIPDPQKPGASRDIVISNTYVKADAFFGNRHAHDDKFYAYEYDRSSEDIEPTKNLSKASWLRKFLCYDAIASGKTPIYQGYLGIPNMQVLCVFHDETRMRHAMKVAQKYSKIPGLYRFKTIPLIDPLLDARIMDDLFYGEWLGLNGKPYCIADGR